MPWPKAQCPVAEVEATPRLLPAMCLPCLSRKEGKWALPGKASLGHGAHSGLEQGAGFLGSQSLEKAAQTSVPLSGM